MIGRLRCGKAWLEQPLGLAFLGLRETRSATCPSGAAVAGLRVHRGFQDWGDLDTYEFQLFCTTPAGKVGARGTSGDGPGDSVPSGGASRGRGRKRRDGSAPGHPAPPPPPRQRTPQRGSSAFGSRAADADRAAEEVRAELAAHRASLKDEL